jgi:FKBP-type peptidyl-prolyl cis-trans isomerase 2
MVFKDGDFLEVEYNAWTAADNGLIATTDEKKAKDANIYDEHVHYGSVLIILGSNSVIKGLDKSLRAMSISDTKKMNFKPEEAFGERMPDLVRVMPISEFRKRDIDPYPGLQVNIDNSTAMVKSVNSGRVTIDLNHPYAGQEIIYEVKIIRQLNTEKDKVKSLGRTYNVEPTDAEVKEKTLYIKFSNDVKKNADYFVGKANLVAAAFTYLKELEKIMVDEEYMRPKEEPSNQKSTS